MSKIHHVQIGQNKYPVAYSMSAIETLEEVLEKSITQILSELNGQISAKSIRRIVQAGLNDGARLQGGTEPKYYELEDLDELLLGNALHSYKIFIELLIKDSGVKMITEDVEREEAKNLKARAKT